MTEQNYPPPDQWQNLPEGAPSPEPDRGPTTAKVAGALNSLRRGGLKDAPEGATP